MKITIIAVLVIILSLTCGQKEKLRKEKAKLLDMMGNTLKTWYNVTKKERLAKYACPTSPYFNQTPEPKEKKCTKLLDCIEEEDELCCYWSSSQTSHCLKGILKEEHPGECPTPGPWNDACLADFSGCVSDRECTSQSEKCCPGLCGYHECLNIRQNLGCPSEVSASGEACTRDDDCGLLEKCCGERGSKKCQAAVDISQRPGFCFPAEPRTPSQCAGVTASNCNYDSECPTGKKCCSSGCGRLNNCVDLPFKKEVVEKKDENEKLIELLAKALRKSS